MKKSLYFFLFILFIPAAYATSYFTDVPEGEWYEDSVSHLFDEGVIEGYEDDTYRPEAYVNRAELAVMLDRYETMIDESIETYFETRIDDVISNTLSFGQEDYDYEVFLIMAESNLKKIQEEAVPYEEALVPLEANLPEGYTIYKEDYDYDRYYLFYEGERHDSDGYYDVEEWFGPF